jgi:beta-mannosidase
MAIAAQRKAAPNCMGSLFWQWNDCWPVSSWSAVDYYGRPKALYEQLKSAFNDNFLVVDTQENLVKISWTRKTPFSAKTISEEPGFEISLMHQTGKVLKSWSIVPEINVFEGLGENEFVLPLLEFSLDTIEGFKKEECILSYSTLYTGCEDYIEYPAEFTFVRPKDLKLTPEKIKWTIRKCSFDDCKKRYYLNLSSNHYQKDVFFLDKDNRLNFLNKDQINISENLPQFFNFYGEIVIYHGTKKEIRAIKKAIEVQTLNQFLGKNL